MEIRSTQPKQIAFKSLHVNYEEINIADDIVSKAITHAQKYRQRWQQLSTVEQVANVSEVNIGRPSLDELFLSVGNKKSHCTVMTPRFETKGYKTPVELALAIEAKIGELYKILVHDSEEFVRK